METKPLENSPEVREQLAGMMIEVVAEGGSVGFMQPLEKEAAISFWRDSLASAEKGERVILGAWEGELLVGTVTLGLEFPPNQPHRAEISKTMTRPGYRGRGIATRLMKKAESIAAEKGRSHLMLDTATVEGASGLYESLGYVLAGEIPDFALTPDGRLTGTKVYWKRIGKKPVTLPV